MYLPDENLKVSLPVPNGSRFPIPVPDASRVPLAAAERIQRPERVTRPDVPYLPVNPTQAPPAYSAEKENMDVQYYTGYSLMPTSYTSLRHHQLPYPGFEHLQTVPFVTPTNGAQFLIGKPRKLEYILGQGNRLNTEKLDHTKCNYSDEANIKIESQETHGMSPRHMTAPSRYLSETNKREDKQKQCDLASTPSSTDSKFCRSGDCISMSSTTSQCSLEVPLQMSHDHEPPSQMSHDQETPLQMSRDHETPLQMSHDHEISPGRLPVADDSGYRTSSESPISSASPASTKLFEEAGEESGEIRSEEEEMMDQDDIDPVGEDSFDCKGHSDAPVLSDGFVESSYDTLSSSDSENNIAETVNCIAKTVECVGKFAHKADHKRTVQSTEETTSAKQLGILDSCDMDYKDNAKENQFQGPKVTKPSIESNYEPISPPIVADSNQSKWRKGHIENILKPSDADLNVRSINNHHFWMNNMPNILHVSSNTSQISPNAFCTLYPDTKEVSSAKNPSLKPYSTHPLSSVHPQGVMTAQYPPLGYGTRPALPHGALPHQPSIRAQDCGYDVRDSSDGPVYVCQDCGKSYTTYSGLSKHKQFHCSSTVKKEFSCKQCSKTYTSLGALKMHIRTHTLPCKCQLCGKSFSRPWLLQGHIRTHTGEKPFSCQHCQRSFADRSNLRAHLQTHSDIKKYCCKNCSKTFSRMSLLTKHEDGGCSV